MPPTAAPDRPFLPGTTGWTVHDLDEPDIEREWFRGRYEIVEGVLTTMPAAYFAGSNALFNLIRLLKNHLEQHDLFGRFGMEVDVVVDEVRVARADAVMLTAEDEVKQAKAAAADQRPDPRRTRILVPPTLIIESISPGHERHDLRTKRTWYAQFGVPHYWILDAFAQLLDCLELAGAEYHTRASGRGDAQLTLPFFQGLTLDLGKLWRD